ncbi:MAG: hypothetical protein KA765_01060 [Thermoflexales bacterium]|nr:hypothetical protein [Thermoflexales bacterium]
MKRLRTVRFTRTKPQTVFEDEFKDSAKTNWSIKAYGSAKAVGKFITNGKVACMSEPLTPEAAQAAVARIETAVAEYGDGAAQVQPQLYANLPVRKIRATIEQPNSQGPFHATLKIDPELTELDPVDNVSVGIGYNSIGELIYSANGGEIRLEVESGAGQISVEPGSNGAAGKVLIRSDVATVWRVNVVRVSGVPTYELTGLITINY